MKHPAPAIVEVALRLYEVLDDKAQVEEYENATLRVFRGSMLESFLEVSSSRGYYTPVYRLLELSNSVSIAERGGRSSPSVLILHERPSTASLATVDGNLLTTARVGGRVPLEQEVANLRKAIAGIDIPRALQNQEKRIRRIEQKLGIPTEL